MSADLSPLEQLRVVDELDEPEEHQHVSPGCDWRDCDCGRGRYRPCKHRSCYECFLDRLSGYRQCIFCGQWHAEVFDTCFKCRPETRGRDDAARALRQLILWRDDFRCQYCGALEGEMRIDPRLVRPACRPDCPMTHNHRLKDDDGLRHTLLHIDHIVPCARGGRADEWNLQALCFVCNVAKGATWYAGSRHDRARTSLCRRYFLIAREYFNPPELERFLDEVVAYRATRTWDPDIHAAWHSEQEV